MRARTNGAAEVPSRIPPHDLDAEAAVLSALMLDKTAIDQVVEFLRPEHFYAEANRRIYEAAVALHHKGKTLDLVSVAGELRDRERFAQVGGAVYLAQIVDAVPCVDNLPSYGRRIHDKFRVRQLIATCQRIATEGYGDVGDESEFIEQARGALNDESALGERSGAVPSTPADIIGRWRHEGPLVRVPTGIRAIDVASHGGLPVPWRVIVVGAPAAGKTFLEMVIAKTLATNDLCVGILGVDEEPEDLTVRFLQMAGFSTAAAELRETETLAAMAAALSEHRLRFYDAAYTIESAGLDLAAWSKAEKRRGALFVDSLHTARSDGGALAKTPRESTEANLRALRWVSTTHRLLVVATAEANRAAYKTEEAAETTNDLSAGAESRTIEFGAQTLLVLRTPKGEPDIIHARIAKNRRANVGEFWLRIARDRHGISECGNPAEDPHVVAKREDEHLAGNRHGVLRDADVLADAVRHQPGIGERDLRATLRAAGNRWGVERYDAAKHVLTRDEGHKGVKLVDRGPHARAVNWYLEPIVETP